MGTILVRTILIYAVGVCPALACACIICASVIRTFFLISITSGVHGVSRRCRLHGRFILLDGRFMDQSGTVATGDKHAHLLQLRAVVFDLALGRFLVYEQVLAISGRIQALRSAGELSLCDLPSSASKIVQRRTCPMNNVYESPRSRALQEMIRYSLAHRIEGALGYREVGRCLLWQSVLEMSRCSSLVHRSSTFTSNSLMTACSGYPSAPKKTRVPNVHADADQFASLRGLVIHRPPTGYQQSPALVVLHAPFRYARTRRIRAEHVRKVYQSLIHDKISTCSQQSTKH